MTSDEPSLRLSNVRRRRVSRISADDLWWPL